jgi:hypothetical protein
MSIFCLQDHCVDFVNSAFCGDFAAVAQLEIRDRARYSERPLGWLD